MVVQSDLILSLVTKKVTREVVVVVVVEEARKLRPVFCSSVISLSKLTRTACEPRSMVMRASMMFELLAIEKVVTAEVLGSLSSTASNMLLLLLKVLGPLKLMVVRSVWTTSNQKLKVADVVVVVEALAVDVVEASVVDEAEALVVDEAEALVVDVAEALVVAEAEAEAEAVVVDVVASVALLEVVLPEGKLLLMINAI